MRIREVQRMKSKWRKVLAVAAVLAVLACVWFFTGNTKLQGETIDRLVISSAPRMDLQKVTEDPEQMQLFAKRWNEIPCYPWFPPLGNGTMGRFQFRTRETGNTHTVFITGPHNIQFDKRSYYTPVDLTSAFPKLYAHWIDAPEEPFTDENP